MPMLEKYRHYFNIDPDYFPAVNEAVITKNPEVWKKFFPHETFVKLLKNTVSVLERKQKLCLWVEGAYGTGKSHAVHTLKKLLDSSEEETREYFQRHKMDNDLYNRFQAVKSSGRILTVHRYGSASIRSDHNLVFAIQESIEKALVDAGIENKGGNALKDATIAWLSDKDNKNYFNGLITGTYSDLFGGDDADTVIEKLRTFSGEALARIMDNIFKVADERQVKALSLSVTDLGNWIREVIRANSLKAIVFMWDEFTEYFYNNARNLTGFQELCEISETDPFYFVLVTHVTQGLFHERDQDFIKLNGRFVSPHSLISLPENIAFQLMGAAMEKNKDEVVLADWEVALGDLTDRTQASRKLVKSVARITDKEMIDILPIHPYAALLLKHISSAFDSNQRSMFDFIKNDRGDEIKGFQWFIDNFGPEDDNPLLSVDMLWEFFYDKGKEYLSHDIRSILDYYNRAGNQRLDSDQKRVLKTVLLLQAISQYAGDSVELFIPNEKNLDNAFEGTDMEGSAARCADQLVREKVLFSKSLGGGKFQYAAYNHENEIDVTPFEEQIDRKSTSAFITEELADRTRIVDGQFNIGGYEGKSDAGIIFLGNIAQDNMDEWQNMFSELPSLFQESALVDRIHGFIKGWDIPRMNDDLKLSGWALNSEYFCTILHELRNDVSYRAIVDQIIDVPDRADTRDTEAVKRIATAYLKLLFPNVRSARDINPKGFQQYCLRPAVRMRKIIKRQLGILDVEFKGKDVPSFSLKEIPYEN